MATWGQFEAEQPDLAAAVLERLRARTHLVMATLRADGSPRLAGTEVTVGAGELWLAGMTGARRFDDLRRDPRVAVHSGSEDPPSWVGDARVAGSAHEVADRDLRERFRALLREAPDGPFELFRVELTEAVHVGLETGGQALLVRSWRPGRGVSLARRA